jgi:hypothetical protein
MHQGDFTVQHDSFNHSRALSDVPASPPDEDVVRQVHLTPRDLADRWHTSVGHLANLRSRGAGPAYLKLGRVLYPLAAVEAYEVAHLVARDAA